MAAITRLDFTKSMNPPPPEIIEITEPLAMAFPMHIFPELLQNIVKECNQALQFPVDFIAPGMLIATASSFGNHYHVKVREQHTEPAVFWLCIAGSPGVKKSPSLDWLLRPISKRDAANYDDYQSQMQDYEENQSLTPAERKAKLKTGKQEKPVHKVSILKDITLESLIQTHQENKKGLLVYADELLSWISNFNKYNKGNDEPYWLSMWSGQSLFLKRKTSASSCIKQPDVNVIGGIQINRLRELLSNSRQNNGTQERILFAIPDIEAKAWQRNKSFDYSLAAAYDDYIGRLYDLAFDDEPLLIGFSPEATDLLFDWQADNTVKVNANKDSKLGNILSKWESYLVRFALVLQVMHDNSNGKATEEISVQAVEGAIELHSYFLNHTQKVMNLIDQPAEFDGLESWQKILIKALPESFERKDAIAYCQQIGKSERTIDEFLKTKLFIREANQGHYRKRI